MKAVFLVIAIFFFSEAVFSQWKGNEDPLTLKELRLTKQQQKRIKKINKVAAAQINVIKTNRGGEAVKIDKVNGARIKKIRKELTPEQQEIWRKKLMENEPRRGVKGLPYE